MGNLENSSVEKILNPRGFEHPVLTGVALGGVTAYAAGIVISGWLHRSTHGGVEYSDGTQKVWRGANWLLTGMPKADWVDHLVHHAYPDQENSIAQDSWNKQRPVGSPESPIEVWRDPYSVILEGYPKVLFNTSGLHRLAKKAILPFLFELDEFDKINNLNDREHWPEHLVRFDIEEANPNAFRNKYPFLGLVLKGTVETALLGPSVSIPLISTHIIALIGMGGDINSINHTGQTKGFINRLKVIIGKEKPIPDEKGEYAADILTGFESVVIGEQRHKYHHDHPQEPYLSGKKLRRDPVGFLIDKLVKMNLAKTPGSKS